MSNLAKTKRTIQPRHLAIQLVLPVILLVVFWVLGIIGWQVSGFIFPLINFGYLGTALGVGMAVYTLLPREKKPIGRRLAQFLVGGYLLVFLGFISGNNVQLEGFFFELLAGVFSAGLIHYLIAKVFGPLLFGRAYCGWACWTAMVLDLLPFKLSPGWATGRTRWLPLLRLLFFLFSLALALGLWFVFGYRESVFKDALYWLLAGNVLYYAAGIALAFLMRDNRAFCKYLCPITVILKLTTRFSLVKIKGEGTLCTSCDTCTKACPMSIRISDYVKAGTRVLSTECTFCQSCLNACPIVCCALVSASTWAGKSCLLSDRYPLSPPRPIGKVEPTRGECYMIANPHHPGENDIYDP